MHVRSLLIDAFFFFLEKFLPRCHAFDYVRRRYFGRRTAKVEFFQRFLFLRISSNGKGNKEGREKPAFFFVFISLILWKGNGLNETFDFQTTLIDQMEFD
jgi:hypothetical protein